MKRIISLTLLLIAVLMLSNACTKSLVLKFENQTDQNLNLRITGRAQEGDYSQEIGIIASHETKKMETISDLYDAYYIEARDASGNVLYSKEFTWEELEYLHNTIVIPPVDG